jgi:hypothetical protein
MQAHTVSKGLGWFSIGLGLSEIFMARTMARALGMRGREGLVRAYGVREIATGIGILTARGARERAPWIWARVAGDALDLATLEQHRNWRNLRRGNVALAMGAVVGVTALDLGCAAQLTREHQRRRVFRDYSDRSGFPRPPQQMRGIAAGAQLRKPSVTPASATPATAPVFSGP